MKKYAKFTTEELINMSKNSLIEKSKNIAREPKFIIKNSNIQLRFNIDLVNAIVNQTSISRSSVCKILKDAYELYDKNPTLLVKNAAKAINETVEQLIKRDNNLISKKIYTYE